MTLRVDGLPKIRTLAFHLPQYHPIPENDEWWGKGFTEWRNVVRARPQFPGHYQPQLPADLGFYDLRVPETRQAQADMARDHGISGFCYYHYWFNGRRILEHPVNEVLASGKPEFPFCLCWANENWTRVWDGGHNHVLLEQRYGDDDDHQHIQSLLPAFHDPRYVRVDGKPVFLVYRTGLLPNPQRTAETWRRLACESGLAGLYLVRVESHGDTTDPRAIGFDASVEFAPFNGLGARFIGSGWFTQLLTRLGLLPRGLLDHSVYRYQDVANVMMNTPTPPFKRHRCVTPGWDNTARRARSGTVLLDSTPERYEHWLSRAVVHTRREFEGEQRLVFINAWNEWAEGNHLEPDLRWGRAYLEATLRALKQRSGTQPSGGASSPQPAARRASWIKRLSWSLRQRARDSQLGRVFSFLTWRRYPR